MPCGVENAAEPLLATRPALWDVPLRGSIHFASPARASFSNRSDIDVGSARYAITQRPALAGLLFLDETVKSCYSGIIAAHWSEWSWKN